MPSFLEGFANKLSGHIDQAAQDKLQLAMLSRRIEMEATAQEKSKEAQFKRESVSGAQMGGLAKMMGVPEERTSDLSGLFPEGMSQAVAGHALSALASQSNARANVPHHIFEKPDTNGLIKGQWIVPSTGQSVGQPSVSLEPQRMEKIAAADTSYNSMKSTLDRVGVEMKKVLTEHPEAAGVPIQRINGWLQEHGLPMNPELKTFQDTMPQVGLTMAKLQDGTIRGWEMAKTDIASLPNLTDSLQSGTMKLDQAQKLIKDRASATHLAYDPSNFLGSEIHPHTIGAQQATSQQVDPMTAMRKAAQARMAREAAVDQAISQKGKSNGK